MSARDPLNLVEAIAQDLKGSLGRKIVSRVIGKHLAAIEALVADGYPAEAIFDRILSLTQSSAPSVKKGALRKALYRARESDHADQERIEPIRPTEMPQASPPAGTLGTAETSRHASPAADERRHAIRKRAALLKPD